MFQNAISCLKPYENGAKLEVELPLDDDRYLDRQCPNERCGAEFKVFYDDWTNKVSDEEMFCPLCRESAPSDSWATPEQTEFFTKQVMAHFDEVLREAFAEDARQFNAKQMSGLITLRMSFEPGAPIVVLPLEATESMRIKAICEACECRYAAIGIAFFCPACGHNSAAYTFESNVQTIRESVETLDSLLVLLEERYGVDAAQNYARQLLEDKIARLVGAFQRLVEVLYQRLPKSSLYPARTNVFQNLTDSSDLWSKASGNGYEDLLTDSEIAELNCFFQQRHLILHCDGVVDQRYLDRTIDSKYKVGQRLVINKENVLRLSELVLKLGSELRKLVG